MNRIAGPFAIPAAAAVFVLFAAPASAAAPTRVWVSNAGVDNASCGAVTAPCRTFNWAYSIVSPGGEIGVLTPGDYGAVQITKSLAITNDGTGEAGIQTPGGRAIHILASAGDVVSLRGLIIDGAATGLFGITFQDGSAVHIQNCVIRNFEGATNSFGLVFAPSGHSQLFLSNSLIYN